MNFLYDISQYNMSNMKLKLVKNVKNFVKILELLGNRLEVCVSVLMILVSGLQFIGNKESRHRPEYKCAVWSEAGLRGGFNP